MHSFKFLAPTVYDEYNLGQYNLSNTIQPRGCKMTPHEMLSILHFRGSRWEFLLFADDNDDPVGVMAIEWERCDSPYAVTPILHYDIFKGKFKYVYNNIEDILDTLCQYFNVARLTIAHEYTGTDAWRLLNLKDLSKYIRLIKLSTMEYYK